MRASADPGLVRKLSVFASAASVFSVAVGVSVLGGWTFHIATLITWGLGTPMAPNAAGCTMLSGVSLWLLRKKDDQARARARARARTLAAQTAAVMVSVVGLLTLAEHIFGLNFGIDRLLLVRPLSPQIAHARILMAPAAAGSFALFGLALLAIDWRTRREDWPAQFLCLGAALAPAFGFLGVILGPKVSPITLALPAVVSYFLLTSGLLCSRATWALGGLLTSRSLGARLLRGAVPAALLVLSLIGWFISKPLQADTHIGWVEASVLAVFASAALVGLIAWMAFLVERSDLERRRAETALHSAQGRPELDRIDEPESEKRLLRKVNWAFAVALLLTGLLGLLSWRNTQRAAEDADWVAHTHEVSTRLELTLRHLIDTETGWRGFALTGDGTFLEPYQAGRDAVGQDLRALRLLVLDNHDQERRLDVLDAQADARIEAADDLVILRRKTGTVPTEAQLQRGKQIMDEARVTVAQMEAEERRLLEQRSQRARAAQHVTISVIALGSVVGVVFLSIAGATVSREIGISARARAQVDALNLDLERRVAQRTAALGESEGRLAGVIQSAMDAILTVDEHQNIVMFNSAAERMFRCPAAEALGQPITRFIPQRFHAAHAGHIHRFGDTGVTNRAMGPKNVLWGLRADGQEFQIEASISQVVTGGKKLFTVILRDITERIQAETVREHLAAVVDSSDDAIISKDLNGTINAWNRGAEKIFGYSAAEATGKTMRMIIPPERASEETEILARIGRGESVEHFETVRVRKDGKKIDVSVTISPIRDSIGAIVGASKIARDITERRKTDAALAEQASMLDSAQAFVRDMESRVVFWPRGAEKLYGFTRQEALGILSHDLFHTKFPEPLEVVEKKLFETGMWEGELIHTRRDGSIIVVSSAWVLHRDSQGLPVRILETNIDITARKQAENQLRESEDRFRLFVEHAPAALAMFDREMRYLHMSRRWRTDYGLGERELRGVSHYEIFPEIPERWKEIHRRGLAGEVLMQESDRFDRPDGSVQWIRWEVRPWYDRTGAIAGILVFAEEITERKQAQERLAEQAEELSRQAAELTRTGEALEEQSRMLQLILESAGEGLIAADRQGRFLIWNDSAKKILGSGPIDLTPDRWAAHYKTYQLDGVTPCPTESLPLVRALKGESLEMELIIARPEWESGALVEFTARPMKDDDGNLCGGVVAFRDVTQRKKDEREIRKRNQELEERVVQRTAQLAAVNQELEAFTYSVSHDLRAPLRHIGGFSKILSEDFGPGMPPEAQSHLKRIEDGVHRMGRLADELLNLARVGRHALKLQVSGLDSIVEEVVSLLQPETQGRAVAWKIEKLPSAECDPILIKQVFQNLLANALKFTRPREQAVIEISHQQENGRTVIVIRDNGVGFNMKYSDKLFGVFQRLHRADDFEGTGIGLATVHRIIHKHGGRVWAEAELDKGATFYFTLGAAEVTEVKPTEGKPTEIAESAAAGAQV